MLMRTTILGSGLAEYRLMKSILPPNMATTLGMTHQDLAAMETGALAEPPDIRLRITRAYPDFFTTI
jgi:DNA-binding XRE family transcriptional regulator